MGKPEIYKDEGYKLMGAAFEVFNIKGGGMAEEIYQECVEIELSLRGIPFRAKPGLTCEYKGRELSRRYIPDLQVFECLVVELKSVSQIVPEHEAQLMNYLKISRQPVGYLLNYGQKDKLEWKRFILSELINPVSESASISAD